MWIFPWFKHSWYSCSMWDKLGWLNWFWQFLCEGFCPLIPKDCVTHMHDLAVYLKKGQPFAQDLSLNNSGFTSLDWLYFTQCLTSFSYHLPSLTLCTVFDAIWSNIDDVLLIDPSANVFVFGDFNIHCRVWLTYSGGTDRPGELYYSFTISNCLSFFFLSFLFLLSVFGQTALSFSGNVLRSVTKEACAQDLTHSLDTTRSIFVKIVFQVSAFKKAQEMARNLETS